MNAKALAFITWTVIVVLSVVGLTSFLTQPKTYDDLKPFAINESNFVIVRGTNASARFASSNFFVLRQGDRVISGLQTTPPLGWNASTYFVANAENFNGTWEWSNQEVTSLFRFRNLRVLYFTWQMEPKLDW